MNDLPWKDIHTYTHEHPEVNVTENYHNPPMLSLQNAYNHSDLTKFFSSVRKKLGIPQDEIINYGIEPKIDGLAISLVYHHGKFSYGLTRGDGVIGEDVTSTLTHVHFPKVLNEANGNIPSHVEIRGEIYLPAENLEKLNTQRNELRLELYKTPRNTAVALLKQKDPNPEEVKLLRFKSYDVPSEEIKSRVQTQQELMKLLKNWCFEVPEPFYLVNDLECFKTIITDIGKKRYSLKFPIDGAVIKVNSLDYQKKLGESSHYPRWARAWKFPASEGVTELKGVTWQLGRLGYFTPVAELEPVEIDGVTIKRASLHNPDYIQRKGIKLHSRVIVERRGDVIPAVTGVMVPVDDKSLEEIVFPTVCPSCGSPLILQDTPTGSKKLKCPGEHNCPEQYLQRLYHHVQGLKIKGLGRASLRAFYEHGLLNSSSSIFDLLQHAEKMKELPGWSEKKVTNLLLTLQKIKDTQISESS